MSATAASDCWFLTGPTASGKTGVGIELAKQIGAEIVSLDSMALYRNMNIGTAKPTAEQRRTVTHHLVDVLDPHQEYSLAQYVEAAEQSVHEIQARGRQALFVGGTPLYLKGLLRGIFEGPAPDWLLRRRLQDEAREHGAQLLHDRLTRVDALAAERLHPNDTRRIIRALEVFEKTGQPISTLQQQFDRARSAEECRVFVLDWPRVELYSRIERRVDEMFATGLVEEVRNLLAHHASTCPKPLSRTARQAVGYREVIDHVEGKQDLGETVDLVKTHTRQLAKRQGTWFRGLAECRFTAMAEPVVPDELASMIARAGDAS